MERRDFLKATGLLVTLGLLTGDAVFEEYERLTHQRKFFPGFTRKRIAIYQGKKLMGEMHLEPMGNAERAHLTITQDPVYVINGGGHVPKSGSMRFVVEGFDSDAQLLSDPYRGLIGVTVKDRPRRLR